MVGNHHDIARAVALVYTACRVRHNHLLYPQQLKKPHGNGQLLKIVALVGMESPGHAHELLSLERAEDQLSGVVRRGGNQKIRNLPVVQRHGVFDLPGKRSQPRA